MNTASWTWESEKEFYEGFWGPNDVIPEELLSVNELALHTRRKFIAGPDALFEPLALHQPLTFNALKKCALPVLVRDKKYTNLSSIVTHVDELMVFIEPFTVGDELIDWDHLKRVMPDFLLTYYTNFNGLHASHKHPSPAAYNLPANLGKWRRANDYQKEEELPKSVLKRITKELGDPEYLVIVLQTDWRDLVLINKKSRDKKVYAIPGERFDDFFELKDPASQIDALCAHVLSGAKSEYRLARPAE